MDHLDRERRSMWIWTAIAVVVVVACGVNAWLEETTLMRVLSIIGAVVGLLIGIMSVYEYHFQKRQQELEQSGRDVPPASDESLSPQS